jgi:hypothetical protein
VFVPLLVGACSGTSRHSLREPPTSPTSRSTSPTTVPLNVCLTGVSGGALERPSGIAGTLRVVGGPPPGINRPVAGTVRVVSSSGVGCDVSVGPAGFFDVTLPTGRYTVTGYSPSFGNGKGLCSAGRSVNVGLASVGNNPVVINVFCPAN